MSSVVPEEIRERVSAKLGKNVYTAKETRWMYLWLTDFHSGSVRRMLKDHVYNSKKLGLSKTPYAFYTQDGIWEHLKKLHNEGEINLRDKGVVRFEDIIEQNYHKPKDFAYKDPLDAPKGSLKPSLDEIEGIRNEEEFHEGRFGIWPKD